MCVIFIIEKRQVEFLEGKSPRIKLNHASNEKKKPTKNKTAILNSMWGLGKDKS